MGGYILGRGYADRKRREPFRGDFDAGAERTELIERKGRIYLKFQAQKRKFFPEDEEKMQRMDIKERIDCGAGILWGNARENKNAAWHFADLLSVYGLAGGI